MREGVKPKKNSIQPQKLLISKWTAVSPQSKRKHFLVTRVLQPEPPTLVLEWIELEAVMDRSTRLLCWHDLKDRQVWLRGWL